MPANYYLTCEEYCFTMSPELKHAFEVMREENRKERIKKYYKLRLRNVGRSLEIA